MKEIIFGSINPAKTAQVRDVLEPLRFEVKSLVDFDKQIIMVEDGEAAEENALKKAPLVYHKRLGHTL